MKKSTNNKEKGITLVVLVVTIVILLILAGITIATITGNNGLLNRAKEAREETQKQTATEKINLKITNMQISSWAEKQEMPTLQDLADGFCDDEEMEYVELASQKQASILPQIKVGTNEAIFVKLKEYPYEFEINKSLQLASINGIKIDSNTDSWSSKNIWEKLFDIGFTLDEIVNTEVIFNRATSNDADINYMLNNTEDIMPAVINSKVAMKIIGENQKLSNLIFGNTTQNMNVNSTWVSAILNNSNAITALDETNPVTVPKMTGYKSPSGEASASTESSADYPAWKAFNQTLSGNTDAWMSKAINPAWIQYEFENPVLVYKFYIQNRSYSYALYVNAIYEFSLLGSQDGENWDNLGNYSNTSSDSGIGNYYIVSNIDKRYRYYRISILSARLTDGTIINSNACIGNLQFYGK